MVKSLFHLCSRSSHHLYFIFLSRVKMNSVKWPAPNIWVFIAQLVEHCSANAEAMGSNSVEALKFFFSGINLQLLKIAIITAMVKSLFHLCSRSSHHLYLSGINLQLLKIAIITAMVKSLFHLCSRSSHHLYFIFLSRVKMNSVKSPAPNIWVFIAQLVEHCSANAEAMGSNPVEALKFFFGHKFAIA